MRVFVCVKHKINIKNQLNSSHFSSLHWIIFKFYLFILQISVSWVHKKCAWKIEFDNVFDCFYIEDLKRHHKEASKKIHKRVWERKKGICNKRKTVFTDSKIHWWKIKSFFCVFYSGEYNLSKFIYGGYK